MEGCFINNKKQIECLSDLLINKTFGASEILQQILRETENPELAIRIKEAVRGLYEIMNWIKYIQIAHDLRLSFKPTVTSGVSQGGTNVPPCVPPTVTSPLSTVTSPLTQYQEKRKEIRYPLPEILQRYIELIIDAEGRILNGHITNLSQHGLQFITDQALQPGSLYNIRLSSRRAGNQTVIKVRIAYCIKKDQNYICGASIIDMPDDLSFNFFRYVVELINTTSQIP